MAVNESLNVTPMTQELRLATTMTGGVSLAIWMAGVAREINLLAQASQWRRLGGDFPAGTVLSAPSVRSLKLYRRLIDLLDVVVDVDILSGTSAGGINGTLLAWSRVRGSDLGGLREIWMDLGALTELLRDPTDKMTSSLLYGDKRMLAELVEQIPKLKSGPFPPANFPELGNPSTTLYVTTTLLNGETSRFTDSFGTLVQDVDRRGVFTFTEEDLKKKEDGPEERRTVAALALAARSSASFPAAFEPSFVPFTEEIPKKGDVPARPPMQRFANITRPHWVADGGLLDNQPIDVLLKRIFDRPAERPVRRVLLFVVPSSGPAPDLVEEPPPDDVDEPLGLVDGLVKDLSAITTQSIAADLRTIRAHQDRMEARTDAKLRLAELATKLPENTRLLTPKLLADYKKREAAKQAQALTSALLRQLSTWPPESGTSTDSIPKNWEHQLAIGGDAEKACREAMTEVILKSWSQPADLPDGPADLARYGEAAFDLAKGCAIGVVTAAYELAEKEDNFTALAELTKGICDAHEPATRIDLAHLVRDVCKTASIRQGRIERAAAALAGVYLNRCAVKADAWVNLGEIFVRKYPALWELANASPPAGTQSKAGLTPEDTATSPLDTYCKYLRRQDDSRTLAMKLFDLAAVQRAMLPAGADIDQSLELVQVSADTRSLLAPEFRTAQQKLTGMQLHHFGAFYKRSWRANDWMWGRLDGAGWLVHVLLDPRRVRRIVETRRRERKADETGAEWFLRELNIFGAPELPHRSTAAADASRNSDEDLTEENLTREDLLDELAFLNDTSTPPPSIPKTSLWLAQVWQQRVLDDELNVLARTVTDPQSEKPTDWSPPKSKEWATNVLQAVGGDAKYEFLKENPVASETFFSDKGSPLMARTLTKAAATASAAVASVRQLPSVVKPPLTTLRTMTLSGYRVVSVTKGFARRSILLGAVILVLGIAFAIQSGSWAGIPAVTMIAIGSYLVVLATWQLSSRVIFAVLSLTVVLLAIAPAIKPVATMLFGDKGSPGSGFVGQHLYWLSADWTHPLMVEGAFVIAIIVLGIAHPDRWRISRLWRQLRRWWQRLPLRLRQRRRRPDELVRWAKGFDNNGVNDSGSIDSGPGPALVFSDADGRQFDLFVYPHLKGAQPTETKSTAMVEVFAPTAAAIDATSVPADPHRPTSAAAASKTAETTQ
jgi:patatin-related protein